jgi:hypothetical protein
MKTNEGKIRAINYTVYSKGIPSTVRRQVGTVFNIEESRVFISDIEEVEKEGSPNEYKIYGKNQDGEYALWKKESALDMKVEYDLKDILNEAD